MQRADECVLDAAPPAVGVGAGVEDDLGGGVEAQEVGCEAAGADVEDGAAVWEDGVEVGGGDFWGYVEGGGGLVREEVGGAEE